MIHCVLHDPNDSVAVVVVEGIKAGQTLTGLILDEDRTIDLRCAQDIPLGHKVALKDMNVGDTVIKYGVDIGKVVAPIKAGQHAHVHNIKTKLVIGIAFGRDRSPARQPCTSYAPPFVSIAACPARPCQPSRQSSSPSARNHCARSF